MDLLVASAACGLLGLVVGVAVLAVTVPSRIGSLLGLALPLSVQLA
jgi:hypothetical protein